MIRFENVSVRYEEDAEPTLRNLDLTIPEGELVLLVGPSGVGKSTLLNAVSGLVPHFTGGTLTGRVTVDGRDTRTHPPRELADVVGTVGQDPSAHFVTDTVEDELAYGMESLGLAPGVMRRRVEETLDLLGLAELRDRPIATLSGGQRQRVAIGSVLTPHPKVLVLDEPTSALDPSAAEDVLAVLQRLVHDLGTTVLLAEHRLERVVQYADQVLLLPDAVLGPPPTIMSVSPIHPPVVTLGRLAGWTPLPLTVRDARRRAGAMKQRLEPLIDAGIPAGPLPHPAPPRNRGSAPDPGPQTPDGLNTHTKGDTHTPAPPAFEARGSGGGVPGNTDGGAAHEGLGGGAPGFGKWGSPHALGRRGRGGGFSLFSRRRRRRRQPQHEQPHPTTPLVLTTSLHIRRARVEALRKIDLRVDPGETVALMGRNGAGKSTLLSALVGMIAPTSGTVRIAGREPHATDPRELIRQVGLVPQEPRDLLYADTVGAECAAADADAGAAAGTCRTLVSELLPGVADDTHPRDLSEGQRLALALAVVLTGRPPLLLLDEPTRGLDYAAKARLVGHLRSLAADGHAIVLATHDVELAAELAHRVVILADGEVVADGPTAEVVVSSPAFSPQVAKILAPQPWLTVEQVERALEEAR
ncbi:ABC transporter ATP-binding protein [Streptomyces sp. S1]|uniref:ABC transporter ATP-binding protein n=1 Tax=Streptomyces sp. S1 TaxID=718288 RepID=UPI000EF78433|nr:ABC transporter ATP-binding protein [Streptomyces sp. S1]